MVSKLRPDIIRQFLSPVVTIAQNVRLSVYIGCLELMSLRGY